MDAGQTFSTIRIFARRQMKPVTAKHPLSPEDRVRSTPPSKRMLDIFVNPGEVFEEVIAAPPAPVNWLVPALLNCFAGILLFLAVAGPTSSPPREDEETPIKQVVSADSSENTSASSTRAGRPS